jgi:hypothetical protein
MASTYLTRTLTTPTSDKIFTFSAWVKRSALGSEGYVFTIGSNGGSSPSHWYSIRYANEKIYVQRSGTGQLITNAVYRDLSAWYHIVLTNDTTQATDSNRIKLYVNGEQPSLGTATYPSQNATLDGINGARCALGLTYSGTGNYFDGSMAHVNFIDGTAYPASTFGETNAASGIWTPIASPSVTYGTNGFFLKFASSGALGTDSSGNSNTFTVNGSGTQTQDAPSNVFCTGNPLYRWNYNSTQTNGNTSFAGTQNQWQGASSTLGISKGKWYFEAKITNDNGLSNGSTAMMIGFMGLDDYILSNPSRNLVGLYSYDGGEIFVADTSNNFATTADYGTFATNDIMGVALDYDNELISYYKNGSAIATNFDYGATPYSSTLKDGKTITPVFVSYGTNAVSANFGNGYFGTTAVASGNADGAGYGIFEYAPPTGYYSLCTKNINTYG